MELYEYPRPTNDTGIGLTWCPGASRIADAPLRDFWVPELVRLGVKWVRLSTQRQALPIAQHLLAADIIPVVALDYPLLRGKLEPDQLREIESLIRAGVRYVELSAGHTGEGRWSSRPPEAGDELVDRIAADIESILAIGGAPGLPAIRHPQQPTLIGDLLTRGYGPLFDGPVWQAVAVPLLNRPLAYPNDQANRTGIPVTQEYFSALQSERNADSPGLFDPWHGQSLSQVNELRVQLSEESASAVSQNENRLAEDEFSWNGYQTFSQQIHAQLGRPLPLLMTGGGWQIQGDGDPRYPAITPLLHMAQTLEACRILMGTSHRHPPATDDLFAGFLGVLASQALFSDRSMPEAQVWYGVADEPVPLPIVAALAAEPKRARVRRQAGLSAEETIEKKKNQTQKVPGAPDQGDADGPGASAQREGSNRSAQQAMITGKVRGGAGATVRLVEAGGTGYTTIARQDGTFRFINLPAGRYTAWVVSPPGSRRDGLMLDGSRQEDLVLSADGWGYELVQSEEERTGSILRVRVASSVSTAETGTLAVRIYRQEEASGRVVAMARRADGTANCEVGPLASGTYRIELLGVVDASGEPVPLTTTILLSRGITDLNFVYSPAATVTWYRFSDVRGTVLNGSGEQARLVNEEGREWLAPIGPKPIAKERQGAGRQQKKAEEADTVQADTDQADTDQKTGQASAHKHKDSQAQEDLDQFAFTDLPPGVYHLSILGYEGQATQNRIFLDGRNKIQVAFSLPGSRPSSAQIDPAQIEPAQIDPSTDAPYSMVSGRSALGAIGGTAPGMANGRLWLYGSQGNRYPLRVNQNGQFYQDNLPEDVYRLSGGGHLVAGLDILAGQMLELTLPPYSALWSWSMDEEPLDASGDTSGAATGQGHRLSVVIFGRQGVPILLRSSHQEDRERTTGDDPTHPFLAVFDRLPADQYWVYIKELGIRLSVEIGLGESGLSRSGHGDPGLTARRAYRLHFRRQGVVAGANQRRYLPL